jgi:hypothetical protein
VACSTALMLLLVDAGPLSRSSPFTLLLWLTPQVWSTLSLDVKTQRCTSSTLKRSVMVVLSLG